MTLPAPCGVLVAETTVTDPSEGGPATATLMSSLRFPCSRVRICAVVRPFTVLARAAMAALVSCLVPSNLAASEVVTGGPRPRPNGFGGENCFKISNPISMLGSRDDHCAFCTPAWIASAATFFQLYQLQS